MRNLRKIGYKYDMIDEKEFAMYLTFKVVVPYKFTPILDKLYQKAGVCVNRMLEDRAKSSSKYYKEIPCVLAKSLISKYQRNKKLKQVKNLVLPVCGDKGKQVKIVEGGIRVPAFFKKSILPVLFPKPIPGSIRQVEFFKRDSKWFMSYSYNTPVLPEQEIQGFIGVDRNSVGNVAVCADTMSGKVRKFGLGTAGITKNFRNRRKNLQKKGAKSALTKIRKKQSRRIRNVNHKVSRSIVDHAKSHRSAIVLEDLGKISKKGKAKRYVQKSQWSFSQLETFIKYKAALLGVPILYVNPAYASQVCSKCGSINKPNGKNYECSSCSHFDHRDSNAAFNLSANGRFLYYQTVGHSTSAVGYIGGPLNQSSEKAVQLESSGGAR
ncbi:MAG: RNA-guided endonuclease InsQ/TnpB family protein [Elusimicrobiota bacterium]